MTNFRNSRDDCGTFADLFPSRPKKYQNLPWGVRRLIRHLYEHRGSTVFVTTSRNWIIVPKRFVKITNYQSIRAAKNRGLITSFEKIAPNEYQVTVPKNLLQV